MTRAAFAAALMSFGLVACVNDIPPPTAQMGASSQAILTAERAGAAVYAPVELQTARAKMAAADAAMRADSRTEARRLAEEAQAAADLATTKTQTAMAQGSLPVPLAGSSTTVTTTVPGAPQAYGGPTSWSPQGGQPSGSTTTTTVTGPMPAWTPDSTTSVGAGKSVSVGVPR
ncbi:DUF4398 domain-containing protein [Azospirillum sp. TSO22-1]|uniref:DUF4398 domain-containing protein n=1 Tax=Azospirillum sp. TSO22-1 TaxID=716789 RepID=UPI000D65800A|nr:DUF4398 domain-containing protein [Azospirillum sp. TSO22-1]